jgi:hypothetical protein
MSPTNPSDKSAQERLEREFEDFLRDDPSSAANAYRKLPRVEPSAALDQRVRALAQRALLDSTTTRVQDARATSVQRPHKWLSTLSAAAVMLLATGAAWRVGPQMWAARDNAGVRAAAETGIDQSTTQDKRVATRAVESSPSQDLEKIRTSAQPSADAAPSAAQAKPVPPPAPAAGGAHQQADRRENEKRAQLQELRRERAPPVAPAAFPKASAKPEFTPPAPSASAGAISLRQAPAAASTLARPPAAEPAAPIVDTIVRAKPEADAASAARSETAPAEAKAAAPAAPRFSSSPSPPAPAPPAESPMPAPAPTQAPIAANLAAPPPAPPPPPAAASPAAVSTLDAPTPLPSAVAPPTSPRSAQKPSAEDERRYQRRLQEHAAETRQQWIERIRVLLKTRQQDEAIWNLRELRKRYPSYELPADLRDIE